MGKQKKNTDRDRERKRATEKILSIVDNLPYDATQECLMNVMLYNLIFHLIQKKKFVKQLSKEQKKVLEAQFFFHLTYFWVVNDRARNFKTFFKEYSKRNIICFNGFNFPQKMQFSKRYTSLRVLISSEW